jgi:uncharacterized SAM-binding protein YcdF (DUF218 family)
VARRKFLSVRTRLILSALALVTILLVWAVLARAFAPKGNTALSRFDVIIVLGSPVDSEGNPTPSQLARVTEAVREYERGVAPRLILSGGPARNQFVEAQVMARTAQAQGVPSSAILMEPQALDTIHNACYSVHIMKERGWHSAEVVSAAGHLPRAGLIFSRMPIEWRTHAAPALEPGTSNMTFFEVLKTVRYLIYADWAERCTP